MAEPVGKPCECIFSFEKHYVELLFNERIDEEKRKYEELEKIISKLPEDIKEPYEGALAGYKVSIRDLETVRDRFKAMPDCKGG